MTDVHFVACSPAAVCNALSLVQAPMSDGHMECLASNDARKFYDIPDFFSPCCIAVTECQVGTPNLFAPTCVLGEWAGCRGVGGEEASPYKNASPKTVQHQQKASHRLRTIELTHSKQ